MLRMHAILPQTDGGNGGLEGGSAEKCHGWGDERRLRPPSLPMQKGQVQRLHLTAPQSKSASCWWATCCAAPPYIYPAARAFIREFER